MKHVIAAIRFTDDGSWVECRCGWRFDGATPETLNEPFQRHRTGNGERRIGLAESPKADGVSPWRRDKATKPSSFRAPKTAAEHQREWRERNPGLHAERMREYRARKAQERAA